MPFLARWPGRIPAGTRCDRRRGSTDLFATCGRLVGAAWGAEAGEDSGTVGHRSLVDQAAPPPSAS